MLGQQSAAMFLPIMVVLAMVIWVHSSISSRIAELNYKIQTIQSEINMSKGKLKGLDEIKKKRAEIEERLNVVERLDKERTGPVRILDILASNIPKEMWFESLEERDLELKITGWAADEMTVSKFVNSLQSSPFFEKVDIESVVQADFKTGEGPESRVYNLKKFSIISRVVYSPSKI